jgi:hypothetical protein
VDFVAGNSKKLQKLGLEGKSSRAVNVFTMCSQCLKMWKVKNMFTLGPTAKATQEYEKTN